MGQLPGTRGTARPRWVLRVEGPRRSATSRASTAPLARSTPARPQHAIAPGHDRRPRGCRGPRRRSQQHVPRWSERRGSRCERFSAVVVAPNRPTRVCHATSSQSWRRSTQRCRLARAVFEPQKPQRNGLERQVAGVVSCRFALETFQHLALAGSGRVHRACRTPHRLPDPGRSERQLGAVSLGAPRLQRE